jgi:hypothetical protein
MWKESEDIMVVQCCVCKQVRHEDRWEPAHDPQLVAQTASHGYCPTCLSHIYAEFNAQQSRKGLVAATSAA